MNEPLHFFNGIDGTSGGYLFAPCATGELAEISLRMRSRSRPLDPGPARSGLPIDLAAFGRVKFGAKGRQATPVRFGGWRFGVDPRRLDQAGWGVVFAAGGDPRIHEALSPLLRLRQEQTGTRFRELSGGKGYRKGESALTFLERNGVGPGPADPLRMPYFLTIVGDPEQIPFDFQFELASQYAVGRICLESLEAYERYAASIVALEARQVDEKEVVFFGVDHPGDPATEATRLHLICPLADYVSSRFAGWHCRRITGGDATKRRLGRLLAGDETPALLFTASHGIGFPCGDPRQLSDQGAILCREWPGPEAWPVGKPIPACSYFSAADLDETADLSGLVHVHFGCFSGGTPHLETFSHREGSRPRPIAPAPFVARLPQALLAKSRSGAAAVVGHVDRTWSSSFLWSSAGAQLQTFESLIEALLTGWPVGMAMDYFSQRRAQLAAALDGVPRRTHEAGALRWSSLWTALNDARSFVILGDPAVRVPRTSGERTTAQ